MFIPMLVSPRSSSCVENIAVDLLGGVVSVIYHNGSQFRYENVSRRAILNLILNKNMSLGFWVNENLLPYYKNVACYAS